MPPPLVRFLQFETKAFPYPGCPARFKLDDRTTLPRKAPSWVPGESRINCQDPKSSYSLYK